MLFCVVQAIIYFHQHIASADPLQPPKIDPNYLANDFGETERRHLLLTLTSVIPDTELLVAGFQFMEKAADVSYLKEIIEAQTVPPVPLSREQLKGFAFYLPLVCLPSHRALLYI